MDFKKIDKKYYLLGIIGALFLLAIGSIVCFKTADSIHKDLRLRIDTLDLNRPNLVYFSLKDSIIAEGVSKGEYLAFEENEDGFDIPLSISYFPSLTHPSAACVPDYGYREHNNINDLLSPNTGYYLSDSIEYISNLMIQTAIERNATICAILPSYPEYGHYFTDLEIDGTRLSKLVDDEIDNPEWIVDSLMANIYRELEAYCGNEHCNVGNDYVSIIVNSIEIDKMDGFNCLCKREKARFRIKNWLEANLPKIKQLTKGCPDMLNAVSQLLDDYHWINQENHERVCALFAKLDTVSYEEKQSVTNQICDEIGYKVPKVDNTTTQSEEDDDDVIQYRHLDFWQNRWKDGDAEWAKNWLKKIAE